MAKKYTVKRGKGGGKPSLDAAMAGFAALSAGFLTFAMPEDIFSGLVVGSGLPGIIAAAQPPLGQTARLAAVLLAAAITFAAIFALLRALGRVPAKGKSKGKPVEVSAEAPRLRRADVHPDAPSRRPLFAGADLGDPLPPSDVDFTDYEPAPSEDAEWGGPVPEFLEADIVAEEEAAPAAFEPQEEQAFEELPEPVETGFTQVEPIVDFEDEDEFASRAQLHAEPAEEPEPAPEEPFVDRFFDEEPAEAEDEIFELEQPESIADEAADREDDEEPIEFGALSNKLPDSPQAANVPIPSLIQRLEVGLIRREHAVDTGAEAPESDDALDQRLRSAIGDLRRMARNG